MGTGCTKMEKIDNQDIQEINIIYDIHNKYGQY